MKLVLIKDNENNLKEKGTNRAIFIKYGEVKKDLEKHLSNCNYLNIYINDNFINAKNDIIFINTKFMKIYECNYKNTKEQ